MVYIGIIGSGFISKGFYLFSLFNKDIKVSKILTRTAIKKRKDFPHNVLTNDLNDLVKNSDIILECSGDVLHASNCINEVFKFGLPVVTVNSEFHITVGSHFYKKGLIFEAEGDQPSCIYKLNSELLDMGFKPLVYGNYKKYLRYNVDLNQARYWSKKNGVSLDKTIAFTDGSKVEIENVFIANSLNAYFTDIKDEKNKLNELVNLSLKTNKSYVDYFLHKYNPSGVFIATNHKNVQKNYLKYLGFKDNYQKIERSYHFCHLEIYKTIKELLEDKKHNLMQNKLKRYMVASITKKRLKKGSKITNGLGSLEVRGVHYNYCKDLMPITLFNNAIIKNDLPENHIVSFNDLEIDNNLALNIWKENVK
jgi:predicted homoserine dehydrogenase-like protein